MIGPRAKFLFLFVLFIGLTMVLAIFGLVIALIFSYYPESVLSVWIEIPLAIAIGIWIYRRGGNILVPSIIALGIMYIAMAVGAYVLPIDLGQWLGYSTARTNLFERRSDLDPGALRLLLYRLSAPRMDPPTTQRFHQ